MYPKRVHRSKLKPGDHVCVRRYELVYCHHGIYVGEDRVIHYTDVLGIGKKHLARVVETSLDEFLRGDVLRREEHRNASPHERIIRRARRLLSRQRYSLLWNNCEHFASYCATGRRKSRQVRRFFRAASWAAIVAGGALAGSRLRRSGGSGA